MKKFMPGVYVDDQKQLHLFLPEILASLNLEDTRENRDKLTEAFKKAALEVFPKAIFVSLDP
jgi:hypothetical protein